MGVLERDIKGEAIGVGAFDEGEGIASGAIEYTMMLASDATRLVLKMVVFKVFSTHEFSN
jgi:hypothetical protein